MTFVDFVAAASCRESDTNAVGGKRKVEALLKVITPAAAAARAQRQFPHQTAAFRQQPEGVEAEIHLKKEPFQRVCPSETASASSPQFVLESCSVSRFVLVCGHISSL